MAQLIVPNAAQMRLIWAVGGSLYALNVLGVVNAGSVAITQSLANTLGTAIKSSFTSSGLGALIHNTVTLANVGIRDLRTANTAEFLDSGAAVAGTGANDILPLQISIVVTLRTAFAGRSFRGRVYVCGFNENQNSVTGAYGGGAGPVTFITGVQSALVASSLNLGVIHRPTEAPLPVTAGFITPVTSIVMRDSVWDTQRRRSIPGI